MNAVATHTNLGALLTAGVTALLIFCAPLTPAVAQDSPQPNILYVVADDLGWKDVGFHGSE